MENNSSSSFVLAKEKVFVTDQVQAGQSGAGEKVAPSSRGQAATAAGAAFLGAAIIAGPAVVVAAPLLIGGMKAMSNADVIRHNLAEKALASHTVSPGQRVYGYYYFELPKGKKIEGSHVVIELTDAATAQPLTFVFKIE